MDINVSKLIEQAEENRIALEQQKIREAAEEDHRIRREVTKEVNNFVAAWLEEMKETQAVKVRKFVTLEDAENFFTSVEVAKEVFYGMGLRVRERSEKTTGIFWWKKVIKPAGLVIYAPEENQ